MIIPGHVLKHKTLKHVIDVTAVNDRWVEFIIRDRYAEGTYYLEEAVVLEAYEPPVRVSHVLLSCWDLPKLRSLAQADHRLIPLGFLG